MAKGSPYLLDRRLVTDPDADVAFPFDRVEENRVFEERVSAGNMKVGAKKLSEWVADIDSGAAQSTALYDTRLAVAASDNIPASVLTIRTGGYSTAGDGGGGLYKRMASAPTELSNPGYIRSLDRYTSAGATDATNGGYWQLVAAPGAEVALEQFGGKGDGGITDNFQPFEEAKYFLVNVYPRGVLRIGNGEFHSSDTWQLKGFEFSIRGAAPGNTNATTLRFAEGKSGIIVHRANTYNEYDTVASTRGADGAEISNLFIWGRYNHVAHGHQTHVYGILLRARAKVSDCMVQEYYTGFAAIAAAIGLDGQNYEGNCNNFSFERCQSYYNGRWGFAFIGNDANAGYIAHCDASYNGRWGFYDGSFLGNNFFSLHTAGNGIYHTPPTINAITASFVVHNSRLWYAILSSNQAPVPDYEGIEPGTEGASPVAWGRANTSTTEVASTSRPAWGTADAYGPCGAYMCDSINARTVWAACYVEDGQPPAQFVSGLKMGGQFNGTIGGEGHANGNWGRLIVGGSTITGDTLDTMSATFGPDSNDALNVVRWTDEDSNIRSIARLTGAPYGGSYALPGYIHTTPQSTLTFGRTSAVANSVNVIDKFFIGGNNNGREIAFGTTAGTGEHAAGDIVLDIAGGSGVANLGGAGWQCTVAGSPGTWKRFGPHMGATVVTANDPLLNLDQLWNNVAVTFQGIKANFTDSASAADSKPLEITVSAVSKYSLDKSGASTQAGGATFGGALSGITTLGTTGLPTFKSGTAPAAGGTQFVSCSSTAGLGFYFGTGDPTITAGKGSIYSRTDATTTTTRLWVNTDGGTTWTNTTTAA
jgi:hypothetical protein